MSQRTTLLDADHIRLLSFQSKSGDEAAQRQTTQQGTWYDGSKHPYFWIGQRLYPICSNTIYKDTNLVRITSTSVEYRI